MRATAHVVMLSCLACAMASTAPAQEMKPKQVDIQYVEPKNPALRPVYEQIRKANASGENPDFAGSAAIAAAAADQDRRLRWRIQRVVRRRCGDDLL